MNMLVGGGGIFVDAEAFNGKSKEEERECPFRLTDVRIATTSEVKRQSLSHSLNIS
jgi:hypothetical protein